MTNTPPTVLVVAYGAEDLLVGCLSLLQGLPVVVVDNASRPETRSVCRDLGATYLDPGGNLGFAGGVNVGLEVIPDGDVLLLNPDARIEPGTVSELARHLDEHRPSVACVAPAQHHPDTGQEQRVVWPMPTPGRQWLIALGLGEAVRVGGFVVGSVMLISREALRAVGPFDERYFLYCEETDWQRRALSLGLKAELVPTSSAEHVGAGTSTSSTRREAFFHAGHELYVRKWFGPRGWATYRAARLAGDVVRSVSGGERARAARDRVTVYRRGPVRHRDERVGRPRP